MSLFERAAGLKKRGPRVGSGGPKPQPGCTLFVRNLAYDSTHLDLLHAFEEVGPVRTAYVVHGKDGKSRGFGYVVYAVESDAVEASQSMDRKVIMGRKIQVKLAKDRTAAAGAAPPSSESRGAMPEQPKSAPAESKPLKENPQKEKPQRVKTRQAPSSRSKPRTQGDQRTKKGDQRSKKDSRVASTKDDKKDIISHADASRPDSRVGAKGAQTKTKMLLIENLDPDLVRKRKGRVEKWLRKHAGVEPNEIQASVFPAPESVPNCISARVEFNTAATAARVARALEGSQVQGREISVKLLNIQASRVIVRNLPWKATESLLRKRFGVCGAIRSARIPSRKDGKKSGFGFVEFENLAAALRATREMNGKTLINRSIAVDWALSKAHYNHLQSKVEQLRSGGDQTGGNQTSVMIAEEESVSKGLAEATDNEDKDSAIVSEEGDEDEESSAGDDSDDDDDDDDDSDDDSDDDDSDDNDSDDDNDDIIAEKTSESVTKTTTSNTEKNGNELTVFVRNLPFEASDDDLFKAFRRFGPVQYARVVVDKALNRCKGVGFVRFYKQSSHKSALNVSGSEGGMGVEMLGRRLIVLPTVDKNTATRMTEERKAVLRKERGVDRRNLYLATEGRIRADSEAGQGMSKHDRDKRTRAEKEKTEKLKNPNYRVSQYRLSVRNLPLSLTEKELRQICREHATEKDVEAAGTGKAAGTGRSKFRGPKIRQVKIVRSNTRTDANGTPRSKRYGFVEFVTHESALRCLRSLNNNPSVFSKAERPIVEFALDDMRKLMLLQKHKMMSAARGATVPPPVSDTMAKGSDTSANTPRQGKQDDAPKNRKRSKADRGEGDSSLDTVPLKRRREGGKTPSNTFPDDSRTASQGREKRANARRDSAAGSRRGPAKKKSAGQSRRQRQKGRDAQREEAADAKFADLVRKYKRRVLADAGGGGSKSAQSRKEPGMKRWFDSANDA